MKSDTWQGRGGGAPWAQEFQGMPPSWHLGAIPNSEAPSPSLRVFYGGSIIGMFDQILSHWWWIPSSFSSPWKLWDERGANKSGWKKFQPITWLVSLATCPHSKATKGLQATTPLININVLWITKDVPFTLTTPEIARVLEALHQGRGWRGNTYFFIYHNITL